jgi:homoserine dehydrogenase
MLNPVKVGILGLGTVGGGTVSVLQRNAQEIERRAGRGIVVSHACARELNRSLPYTTENIKLTAQLDEVVNNPEVEIANGKHIVTANKALIAQYGNEIFAAAQAKGVMVAFEAAVAGGIPVIKAIREGLSANQILWVAGIINGTSNFILTEMREKGRDFADVLAEAQRLGYAEADPTFDIEGNDAAHKLTILSSLAFGIPLQYSKVYTEGITKITREDVSYAEALGYRIKLLGIAKRTAKGIEMRVHPTFIPYKRLIANVDGVMNAVLINGDAVGSTMYYGAGAGAEPTASAVVADLIDVVRTLTADPENRVPHLAFQPNALSNLPILPIEEVETAYYLRMQALDKVGVLAQVAGILSECGISIEAITQKQPSGDSASIVIVTHTILEKQLNEAIQRIEALEGIQGSVMRIRLETL